jgi:ATP-dependent Clp protease ATP-binding subunit ClpB
LDRLLGGKLGEQGLLGTAIDYIGGMGGGILLFDEIEKANNNLVTVFLGALDAARISMANGETKDLSSFYMIMTSNLGSADAMRMENTPYASMRRHVMHQAETFFRPEVLARFTEALVFNRLTYETQLAVCQKFLDKEIKHVQKVVGRPVRVREDVFAFLVKRGYSRMLGARPMRSTIEKEIQNCVINWQIAQGHTVQGTVSNNRPLEVRISDVDDSLVMVEVTR